MLHGRALGACVSDMGLVILRIGGVGANFKKPRVELAAERASDDPAVPGTSDIGHEYATESLILGIVIFPIPR